MVSGFTVSETGKPEKPGKNRKQKLHLTDEEGYVQEGQVGDKPCSPRIHRPSRS